jgi:hypothetical protein
MLQQSKTFMEKRRERSADTTVHDAPNRHVYTLAERTTCSRCAIVDQNNQRTVRDEATEVFQTSIAYIKSKLNKAEFENHEIAARVARSFQRG